MTSAPTRGPLTFVSVVFDAEISLLLVQARSMAIHLEPGCVDGIVVLDNTVLGLRGRAKHRLLKAYGRLADHVSFVRTEELVDLRGVEGWRSQQVAKLMVSTTIRTRHYVVLDAKNHFIGPADVSTFVNDDGRARGALHSYSGHPLRPDLEKTLRSWGASDTLVARCLTAFPPTATPFVLRTDHVRAMIADLEQDCGRSFAEAFESRGLLEFFAYSAWVLIRGPGLDSTFDDTAIQSPTVWPKAADRAGVEAAIDQATRLNAVVFAVHRRVIARADRDALEAVARWWVECGLFDDSRDARALIRRARRSFRPAMAFTRVVERWRSRRRYVR